MEFKGEFCTRRGKLLRHKNLLKSLIQIRSPFRSNNEIEREALDTKKSEDKSGIFLMVDFILASPHPPLVRAYDLSHREQNAETTYKTN